MEQGIGAAVPKLYWEDFTPGAVSEYGAYEVTADDTGVNAFALE